MSKLGLVIRETVDTQVSDFLLTCKPAFVRFVDDFSLAGTFRERSPQSILVGHIASAPTGEQNPQIAAQNWVKVNLSTCLAHPEIDYWEGLEHPRVDSVASVEWFSQMEVERVQLLANHGLGACIGNFSTGSPELDPRWHAFLPAVRAALDHQGILGLQELTAPFLQFAFGPFQAHPDKDQHDEGWLTGRYRKVWRQFLKPQNLRIPIAITALGIDGSVLAGAPWRPAGHIQEGGWQAFRDWWQEKGSEDPEQYFLEQLAWYDNEICQDDFVVGAGVFFVGKDAGSFGLTHHLLGRLGDHISRAGATYPPLKTRVLAQVDASPPPRPRPDDYNARFLLFAQGIHPNALQATWRYLVAYQVTQGQSFHDAVRLCQDRRDVITAVNASPEQVVWLKQHTQANLDLIQARDLKELGQIMNRRLAGNLRFGPPWTAGPDDLRLKWPVRQQPHLILQHFGANPARYSDAADPRQPLHGHEGWDLLAEPGSEVIAAAAGTVLRTEDNPESWPYGLMIRLEHRLSDGDTYQTVYAHLGAILVQEGERVEAGQPLGTSGSSGHCHLQGESYLHFHLQWIGATQRGHRDPWGRVWPRNLIWPGEKMIDAYAYRPGAEPPPVSHVYQYAGPEWKPGRALIGIAFPTDRRLQPEDYLALKTARIEAVKLVGETAPQEIGELRRQLEDPFLLIQLTDRFWEKDAPLSIAPADFASRTKSAVQSFHQLGVTHFEIHHQPNLPQQGLGGAWGNGVEYGIWWITVRDLLALEFPNVKWGFPGLSDSAHLLGGLEMWAFLEQAQAAVRTADWLAAHLSWRTESERDEGIINLLGEYRARWPNKLLMVTEFDNPDPELPDHDRARQYAGFFRIARRIPGLAAAFHLSRANNQQWVKGGTATTTAWQVGNRDY